MTQPHLRAADTDRAAVAAVLGEHMATGRLTLDEFEQRVGRAYAAKTYGELDELTADLPAVSPWPAGAPQRSVPETAPWMRGRAAWLASSPCGPGAWARWLTTAAVVLSIWLISTVALGGQVHPWPVWVLLPWGAVLLAQTLTSAPGGAGDWRRRG